MTRLGTMIAGLLGPVLLLTGCTGETAGKGAPASAVPTPTPAA